MSYLYGLLGPIEFRAITSPTEFTAKREYTYAQHDVVEDRPRLQWLSDDLEHIELTMYWHRSFTDPQNQLGMLRAVAQHHQAHPLILGTGAVRGYYVISEIGETITLAADNGVPIAIECTVHLIEYAQNDPLDTQPATPPPGVSPSAPAQPGVSVLSGPAATPAPSRDYIDIPPADACRVEPLYSPAPGYA